MVLYDVIMRDSDMFLVGLITFIISYIYFLNKDSKYSLPRGPVRLPFIGTFYCHFISIESASLMRRVFGNVVMFYGGSIRAVFLNSYEAIKEAAVTNAHVCSDRGSHRSHCTKTMNPNLKGILQSNYHDRLRTNRSASLTILRNLGVGRSTMEDKILEEAQDLVETIKSKNNESFDPWHMLTCSISNVILSVMLNKRHNVDDPEFQHVVKLTEDMVAAGPHMQYIDAINWFRFIPPFRSTYLKFIAAGTGLGDYMWKYAEKHLENFESGLNSNFVDCWIGKDYDDDANQSNVDKEEFMLILRDFLVAGTETTTTSLKWTIIHMANNQRIQAEVHKEIDHFVGREKPIRLCDRQTLPYIEAIVQEVQRFSTILPLGLPHHTSADTKIGRYDIPANTFIEFNLHAVHMNKKTFGDPEIFRPDRFIDVNGCFIKHPKVIPFAIGKRACVGELLARQELFLFTAALLQKFQFLPPEGVDKIDDKGVLGFTYCPKQFQIRAILR